MVQGPKFTDMPFLPVLLMSKRRRTRGREVVREAFPVRATLVGSFNFAYIFI